MKDQEALGLPSMVSPVSDDCSDFDWGEERNIVIRRQPLTAIYLNPALQIVIRQQGDCLRCDTAPFLIISQEHLPAVIDALKAMLNG